ncbi:hypothetical protein Tco_0807474 [Tanacetum coccineum]
MGWTWETSPLKKRYCNDFSLDEMVDWAEMEVEKPDGVETSTNNIYKGIDATDGVEARTSTTYKEKQKVTEDATEVVKTRRCTIEIDSEGTTKGVKDSQLMKARGPVVAGCGSYQEYLVFMPQSPLYEFLARSKHILHCLATKTRKMPGRPRKKRIRSMGEGGSSTRVSKVGLEISNHLEDVDVVQRDPVREEGADGSRGGARGSRGRGGAAGSRGGASGPRGGRGTGGCKRKPVSTAGTQKRQGKKKVGTSGFAKWFGLQDEPEQTQDEPQQTHHEPMQTQDEDQVEQTQEQAEIDLTQVKQTQEQTQDQVHPQEQPQQAALRMPSVRILQKKLGKQGSSQNTALKVERCLNS